VLDEFGKALGAFVQAHPFITLCFLAYQAPPFIERTFKRLVTHKHRMQLLTRKWRSEPNPNLLLE
jgi:hypothetical protein